MSLNIDTPDLFKTSLDPASPVYPFMEDEDSNLTGYGHQDKQKFSDEVNRFDREAGFEDDCTTDWTDEIQHAYVEPATEEEEPFTLCTKDHPGAVAITTLWGMR